MSVILDYIYIYLDVEEITIINIDCMQIHSKVIINEEIIFGLCSLLEIKQLINNLISNEWALKVFLILFKGIYFTTKAETGFKLF